MADYFISSAAITAAFTLSASVIGGSSVDAIGGLTPISAEMSFTAQVLLREIIIEPEPITAEFSITAQVSALPSGIWNAAVDILSLWRKGCIEDVCDEVQEQVLNCLNMGQQQLYHSARIAEFVTNKRVQEYPPEFATVVGTADPVQMFYAGDVYRWQTHKYRCLTTHDFLDQADYTSPDQVGAAGYWSVIKEAEYELFSPTIGLASGILLPAFGRTIEGVPVDRALQHVSRVVYAYQVSGKAGSHVLSPVAASEKNAIGQIDYGIRPGVCGEWHEDATDYPADVTVTCSSTSPTTLLTPVSTVTVRRGMLAVGGTIAAGTQVARQRSNGKIELDTAPGGALTSVSVRFTANSPPVFFEVFRDTQGRPSIRVFPAINADIDSSVLVEYVPAARRITWNDVLTSAAFDIALPYIELYLMPLCRFIALQSSYFRSEDIPARAPLITERYKEVLAMIGIADIQPPSIPA